MIGGSNHVVWSTLPHIADFSNLHFPTNHVKFSVYVRRCPKYSEALSGTHPKLKRLGQR